MRETDLYDRITQTVYVADGEIEAYVYIAQDKKDVKESDRLW